MIRFINEHRDRFGVELICRVLRPAVQGFLTSRGYRAAIGRAPSARQLRDDLLVPDLTRAKLVRDARGDGVEDGLRRVAGWGLRYDL
ncbi:hypothetical protein AB0O89_14680, partial [Microbacterium sp. NPDC076895]